MRRVLFLCTHNAVRSQMAEGILRHHCGASYDVYSAGTSPQGVHPMAVRVMDEIGIDISMHTSTHVEDVVGEHFDFVVTVCDAAASTCPSFAGAEVSIHRSFSDPSRSSGSEAETVAAFRKTRDEIAAWIEEMFCSISGGSDVQGADQSEERNSRG